MKKGKTLTGCTDLRTGLRYKDLFIQKYFTLL